MGIMGYLRERMGKILAGVIGLALFAFIVGEVVQVRQFFFPGRCQQHWRSKWRENRVC
jgi:hypothetical protein